MGGVQPLGHLGCDLGRIGGGQLADPGDPALQRFAGQELHGHVGAAVLLAVVVDTAETGVGEPGEYPGLAAEPLARVRIVVHLQCQDLDRDRTVEHHVDGTPNRAHSAAPDGLAEAVAAAEQRSRLPGHTSQPPTTAPYRSIQRS